jgi:hypothetical protein
MRVQTNRPPHRANGRGAGTEVIGFGALGSLTGSTAVFLARGSPVPNRREQHMSVITLSPPEVEHLDRDRLHDATLDAINAVNTFVGELALALKPDDPQRPAMFSVQDGLDRLYLVAGGLDRDLNRENGFRDRLDAALDRIGHMGKPAFRARLADAFDEVAA